MNLFTLCEMAQQEPFQQITWVNFYMWWAVQGKGCTCGSGATYKCTSVSKWHYN